MRAVLASILILCTLGLAPRLSHASGERLMLVGGGDTPWDALTRFCDWAGGRKHARILFVTWATSVPDETLADFRSEMHFCRPAVLDEAPRLPLGADDARDLLGALDDYTAIFFSGGDQSRILDVFAAHPELAARMRALYHQGTVFAGTSAGTAMMSEISMTSDTTPVRPGFNLLPGTILDTHFLKRQRQARLAAAVRAHPQLLGIGIEEGAALLVTDGMDGEAVGPVMLFDGSAGGEPTRKLLESGDHVGVGPK